MTGGLHFAQRKIDLHPLQVGRAGETHDAQESQRQRHAGVQEVTPCHPEWGTGIALRDQGRSTQGRQFDEGPKQQQVVGHQAEVHRHHERESQTGARQQVLRQLRRGSHPRGEVDGNAEEDGVDHQQEEHGRCVQDEVALPEVNGPDRHRREREDREP